MTGRARWILAAAALATIAAWLGTNELETPARVVTVVFVALLPCLLLGQAAIPEHEARELQVLPLYFSSMISVWGLGGVALWAGYASGMSFADMGLRPTDPVRGLAWTGAVTLLGLGIAAAARQRDRPESPLLERLLPRSSVERGTFVLLSLSAGVGEEIAFRGFLLPALETATGSLTLAVVVSSLAFGMMHSYQHAGGVLRAAALGALLAAPLIATGSLYASMAAHALYDLVAGLLLADWLLRRDGSTRPPDREH